MAGKKKNNITNISDYRPEKIHITPGMIIFGVIFIYIVICVVMSFNNKNIVAYEVVEGSLSLPNVYEGIAIREEQVFL